APASAPLSYTTLFRSSTACGCWIYCGVHPGRNLTRRREKGDGWIARTWGWAWPNDVRMLYNRCSADAQGKPWSERKKYIWWDERSEEHTSELQSRENL